MFSGVCGLNIVEFPLEIKIILTNNWYQRGNDNIDVLAAMRII